MHALEMNLQEVFVLDFFHAHVTFNFDLIGMESSQRFCTDENSSPAKRKRKCKCNEKHIKTESSLH